MFIYRLEGFFGYNRAIFLLIPRIYGKSAVSRVLKGSYRYDIMRFKYKYPLLSLKREGVYFNYLIQKDA